MFTVLERPSRMVYPASFNFVGEAECKIDIVHENVGRLIRLYGVIVDVHADGF